MSLKALMRTRRMRLVQLFADMWHGLTKPQDEDGLTHHQRGATLETVVAKKESTVDLLLVMSDRVTVKFKVAGDTYETEKGRWCNICK